jgi:hypothetical protein
MKIILVAAAFALLSFSGARAADPVVPSTGSAQGITVPHATPGEPTHRHNSATEGHLIAPAGQQGQSAQQGVTPVNSLPGVNAGAGVSQPHADVVSPRGVVPEVGSAQGVSPMGVR